MRINLNKLVTQTAALLMISALMATGSASQARIDATRQQRQQLKAIAMETRDATMQKRDALRRARNELLKTYKNYNLDIHKAKVSITEINKLQLDLLNFHMDNQLKIREVLNADQFDQFVQMTKNRMHRKNEGPKFGLGGNTPAEMKIPKQTLSDIGINQNKIKRLMVQESKKTEIIDKMRRDSAQLIDIYSTYNLDKDAARKLIFDVHRGQMDLASLNLKMQQTMRSVLNEDQFQQLQNKLSERMRSQRPPRQRG